MSVKPAGILVSLRGTIGSTADGPLETWSCNLFYGPVAGQAFVVPDQPAMDQMAQAIYTKTKPTFASSNYQSNIVFDEVRCYCYEGVTNTADLIGYSVADAGARGTAGVDMPPQVALVVSLEAAGRVKPKYGRIYLPTPSVALTDDGTISASTAEAYATHWASLLEGIGQSIGEAYRHAAAGSGGAARWPLVIASSVAGRASTPVATIRVGEVLDTQRRRRRSLPETYQDAPYTNAGA